MTNIHGAIKMSRLSAGGPGSGRRPGGSGATIDDVAKAHGFKSYDGGNTFSKQFYDENGTPHHTLTISTPAPKGGDAFGEGWQTHSDAGGGWSGQREGKGTTADGLDTHLSKHEANFPTGPKNR